MEFSDYLDYNPESGVFLWKVSRKGTKGKGKEAGTKTNKGYVDVCLFGKKFGLHRIAFSLMGEEIPDYVDHVNGIKSDNRWTNLRPATVNQNAYNMKERGARSGYRNVYYDPRGKKNYHVCMKINSNRIHGGYFSTAEEANKVAIEMRKQYQKEFNFDNR